MVIRPARPPPRIALSRFRAFPGGVPRPMIYADRWVPVGLARIDAARFGFAGRDRAACDFGDSQPTSRVARRHPCPGAARLTSRAAVTAIRLGARVLLALGWLPWCEPLVAIPVARAGLPADRAAPSWSGEHDAAVRLARAGD